MRPTFILVGHCRAGFEPEAAIDLGRLGAVADIEAPIGRGFVVGRVAGQGLCELARPIERAAPIFVRALFVGTGPHPLLDGAAPSRRPDRIAPLLSLVEGLRADFPWSSFQKRAVPRAFASIRLETADTNEGKALSGLARSLAGRFANGLRGRGALRDAVDAAPDASAPSANLHVLLADGARAYIGVSMPPWSSRWPMGIPRLRMPHGAPSRSTLKLAEAFVTFLADREAELVRPGMRAVDLGASPGGWTWQLAHRGLCVVAVDNGPMKGDVRDDPRVTHVRADGLSFRPRRPVDWMVCDIVEQPSRVATLVASWIRDGHAPRSIFNLKLPMKRRYDEVRRCASLIGEALDKARIAHTLVLRQLYHDRDEVTGYVARYDSPAMIPRRT